MFHKWQWKPFFIFCFILQISTPFDQTFLRFTRKAETDDFIPGLNHTRVSVKSVLDCIRKCLTCRSFFYNEDRGECLLLDTNGFNPSSIKSSKTTNGRIYYEIDCEGWIENNGHCYKIVYNKENWYSAKEICTKEGGYLIEINTWEENEWIASQIDSSKVQNYNAYWTGLNDIEEEGVYRWENSGVFVNITSWRLAHVQNFNEQDCFCIVNDYTYWNDRDCDDDTFYFICEK